MANCLKELLLSVVFRQTLLSTPHSPIPSHILLEFL